MRPVPRRQPGGIVLSVHAGRPVDTRQGTVVTSRRYQRPVRFFVEEPGDTIQSKHLRGKFYEEDLLLVLAELLPPGQRVLDVGANVGNHTLYFALFGGAEHVTAVEPNARAGALLDINLALNGCDTVQVLHGVAFSDRDSRGSMGDIPGNLGGAWFEPEAGGQVRAVRGDDVIGEQEFSFVKVDVEGMEMQTLRGLAGLVRRCRPTFMVEVLTPAEPEFHAWLADNHYRLAHVFEQPGWNEYVAAPV